MKKISLFVILSSFFIPFVSLAYTSPLTPLGSKYNPINVVVTEDPIQKAIRDGESAYSALNQTMSRSVVNIPACSSTYKAIKDYKSQILRQDTSNPSTAASARKQLEYLFEIHDLCISNASTQQSSSCPSGMVRKNNTCVTPDSGCKSSYGQYSKFNNFDSNGYPVCGCYSGYEWNSAGTACTPVQTQNQGSTSFISQETKNAALCLMRTNTVWNEQTKICNCKTGYNRKEVDGDCFKQETSTKTDNNQSFQEELCRSLGSNVIFNGIYCTCANGYVMSANNKCVVAPQTKTNDQVCQSVYGINSEWDGTKNSAGELNCGCKKGYSSSSDGKSCVINPPVKSNNQICQDYYGTNSKWDGTKTNEGGPICGCKQGYEWAMDKKSCMLTSVDSPVNIAEVADSETVTPKANSIQKIGKQEPVKNIIPEKKKPEIVKTETKSIPIPSPSSENWHTKVVRWIVNLFSR